MDHKIKLLHILSTALFKTAWGQDIKEVPARETTGSCDNLTRLSPPFLDQQQQSLFCGLNSSFCCRSGASPLKPDNLHT